MAFYAETDCTDPFENLAREALFCRFAAQTGEPLLYLWQNAPCVVIGVNQNPWLECDLTAMDADGVTLVRRRTGGGAVYHDGGNLNYSLCLPEALFDESRQYAVLLAALARLGISAQRSGRNDIVAGDLKISGSAFLHSGGAALQHGTMLIRSELGIFGRYLTPDTQKFTSKGVRSVSARVGNLTALMPALSIGDVKAAFYAAFEREYGALSPATPPEPQTLTATAAEFSAWDFRFGRTPRFDKELARRFPFGLLRILVTVVNGIVTEAEADSDMLEPAFPARLAAALPSLRFEAAAFSEAASKLDSPFAAAVAAWLADPELY